VSFDLIAQVAPLDQRGEAAISKAGATRFERVERAPSQAAWRILVSGSGTTDADESLLENAERILVVLPSHHGAAVEAWREKGACVLLSPNEEKLPATLKLLESVLFDNGQENEIVLEPSDLKNFFAPGAIVAWRRAEGKSLNYAVASLLEGMETAVAPKEVLLHFNLPESYSILEVSESLEMATDLLGEDAALFFQTRVDGVEDAAVWMFWKMR
jgi:hypothetical protein